MIEIVLEIYKKITKLSKTNTPTPNTGSTNVPLNGDSYSYILRQVLIINDHTKNAVLNEHILLKLM